MKNKLYATDAFGRSTQAQKIEQEFSGSANQGTHKAYDKFFAGYVPVCTVNSKGKKKYIRVYRGSIYQQNLTKKQALYVRALYAVLLLISLSLYILGLVLDADSNRCWYAMLLSIIPAILFVRLLFAIVLYDASSRNMKEREYREGSLRLQSSSKLLIYSFPLAILGSIIMFIVTPDSVSTIEILRAALFILAGTAGLAINMVEARIVYTHIPARKERGENNG